MDEFEAKPEAKFDAKKDLKRLYTAPVGAFLVLDVPPARYLMVDGRGDPNVEPGYGEAVQALYAASYTLKFASKDDLGRDYVVPPLEGLWWADDYDDFVARRKDRWAWTMMIRVPDFVPGPCIDAALARARRTKDLPALDRLRCAALAEGRCVQTLHIGPYDAEGPILKALHDDFLPAHGLRETGLHHEIYLSDPRRTEAAKLRTILRQPVEPAA